MDVLLAPSADTAVPYPTRAGTSEGRNRSVTLQHIANLLKQTLEEEKKADAKLTQIGEEIMNPQAAKAARA